ncbi:MAG: hypothetical protein HY020_16715 [Burkholderiales bacterium]|nr:hypothetical protein [Burkholderiales bacterium]
MTHPPMLLALLLAAPLALAAAAPAPPQPLPSPRALPAPRDLRWPGSLELKVDATDTRRRIVTVHERLPVKASGALVLLYPRWEMASHAPTIAVQQLAGLVIHAGSKRLAWARDPLDPHAFHVDVPAGTRALDIDFQYLGPLTRDASAKLLRDFVGLDWNRLLLYPAGHFARQIVVHPRLTLPAGFQHASALQGTRSGDEVDFEPTSLERLIDSPVFAAPRSRGGR